MRISDWSSDVCSSDLLMSNRDEKGALQIYQRLEYRYGQSVHFSMGDLFWAYGADRSAVDAYTLASAYDPNNVHLSNRVRSEERRVGKECVSTCRSRWSTYN